MLPGLLWDSHGCWGAEVAADECLRCAKERWQWEADIRTGKAAFPLLSYDEKQRIAEVANARFKLCLSGTPVCCHSCACLLS